MLTCVIRPIVFTVFGFLFASLGIAQDLPAKTALDAYIQRADESYRWNVVWNKEEADVNLFVIDLVSQSWRSSDEVNRTEWRHWLKLAVPKDVASPFAFLTIGGGSNRPGQPPSGPDEMTIRMAKTTGTVVAELGMVPNQPLVFHSDGVPRTEDDLIGYTWNQYLKTGDPTWPARNPMVKSAVRAMDTITAFMASEQGGGKAVDRFVIAGGSKRGWTTWLAGLDPRVEAIVPIVIDVLNAEKSMRHHFAAYGFWAPAIGNYVQHRIMERMDDPKMEDLYRLVDPYYYRHRLAKPKFIVNATGDQFFLPDSSQFYFDDLMGLKRLSYVPNADHGLGGSDAYESIAAFYWLIANGKDIPDFSWSKEADGTIRVVAKDRPAEVRLWHATNPKARDFRVESIGRAYRSRVLQAEGSGIYEAQAPNASQGWTAYFVELTYNLGPMTLKMTTDVQVTPDVLPYEAKSPSRASRITVVAEATDENSAKRIVEMGQSLAERQLQIAEMRTECDEATCYFNWAPDEPSGRLRDRRNIQALMQWLGEQGCTHQRIQLEAGPSITGFDSQTH